jgi:iron complex outermembrane receptor protein
VRSIAVLSLLALSLNGIAQQELAFTNNSAVKHSIETPSGVITGQIKTTDNQPAAFVTIYLKESNKTVFTDENGYFTIKNVKEGVHTLEITMAGLKPIQKTVEVKNNATANIAITLSEDAKELTEVVITSGRVLNNKPVSIGKIDIHPMDLPQSLTVVGQSLIRDQQAQRLSDVIRNVNGVYVTTTRGNVQESFGARGYSMGNTNMFKNGARVNSGIMPEMSSLERVEVLKGSSAILFGQVAPGGILNMVTKKPKFNRGGEISMRAGSYDLYKPSIDFYGPISSSIAYRVNGTYEKARSYRDKVSSERYYVNPSLLFKLGTKTELIAEGDYLYHEFTPDFGIGTLDGKTIPNVPRSSFFGTDWQYSKSQQTTATVTVNHQLNEQWKLNSSLSHQLYKRDYYGVERIQALANGNWGRPLGKILTEDKYYTGQLNLTGKFKTAAIEHNLLSGVDADYTFTTNYDFAFAKATQFPTGIYDTINILNPSKYTARIDIPVATKIRRREAPSMRFGAYVQDLVKISPKFNVLAGIRWSYVETKAIDSTNLSTNAVVSGKPRFDRAFSPRLGVVYKPTTSTSLFASYANSFNVNSGSDIDGKPIEPSIIDQFELGIKNEFFNGALSANVTAYRIKNNNLAQTAPYTKDGKLNSNTAIKMLSGETTSDGVEVDLATHPIKGLDISAGYSYNYMRYTKTDTTHGSFKTGERLVNNPAHTANTSVFYTFSNGTLKGLKLGVTALYIGDRFGGWNTDVVSQKNAPFTYRSRIFEVDGYSTLDITAGYSFKKVSLLAKVSNVTNTLNYYVHENYSINPIPPTQVMATVSYKL